MALSLLTALHNNLQMKMLLFMGCFMEEGDRRAQGRSRSRFAIGC